MEVKEEYLKFNVGSVDELIKQKLESQFPDVRYRGSSSGILSEVVASVFSLLTFQLNRTASNSSFSKTDSLTSLIDQTKLLGYSPVGYQAGSMFVNILPNDNFDTITYTIPRYSYIQSSIGRYSTTEDLEFTYSGSPDNAVIEDVVMKGGTWVEYPVLFGDGGINQKFTLSTTANVKIDHNSINVYIRDVDNNGKWEEWKQVDSLFLSDGNDKEFEARLNTRETYDIMFGDGVNGCFVPDNAEIAIYYMDINTQTNVISDNEIDEPLNRFRTDRLNGIFLDIFDLTKTSVFNTTRGLFTIANTSANTVFANPETLEEIRRNAPVAFQTQNRLVTKDDYQSFIKNNFSDFISDVLVLSNDEYVDVYMQYYFDQGLEQPSLESRSLYNQIEYADACNFNNVYIFLIPTNGNYATPIQKKLVLDSVSNIKTLTSMVIPSDPIYINFGLATPSSEITQSDLDNSVLEVIKSTNTNRSDDDIQSDVYQSIVEYFEERSSVFNNGIDIFQLNALLLNINGVQGINTINGDIRNSGLQMYQFNPQFPTKVFTTPPSDLFEGVFVPILFDNNLQNKIQIK